jgi:molecular chaperone IbpA
MNARTLDLTPFHRATIGFDQLFSELDRSFTNSVNTGYPPYNIVKINEDNYQIELAVAGFHMEELSIVLDKNELIIEGNPTFKELADEAPHVEWKHSEEPKHFLHKGIANRTFIRTFKIAEHVEVRCADLELGILTIKLVRNLPEELQPKKINIEYKK